ncbi:mandelate racemase/muconate lactonizing enzyme family protein [Natrinema soli]|uniref:Mandelate racemase/muconate lactonizing enzyme family protein n=1 Tax=Natrinema soli TaxID=1930624 RepID=A0ABD5SL88_9EURY|nr:mandelate racemase/muconate lactonizing enzyme family protein [Natrinema soli]
MEITSVRALTYTVPADVPGGDDVEDTIVFVTVETDEGITGYGETGYLYPEATASFVNEQIAPLVTGRNPLETERVWDLLYRELNPRAQTGTWSTAVSAVDIALWDIKGKAYDEPIWRLLGGASETVPVYHTIGRAIRDEERLAEIASGLASDDADRIKIVVGKGEWATPSIDAERVTAVRDAIGDDVELAIDANYLYSVDEALELCNRLESASVSLSWFEEPVYGNDVSLLSDLRNRTRVPLGAGQNEGHRFRHRELIENGAIDISMPNACFVGGFTEATKVVGMAEAFNLRLVHGGGWPFQNAHLYAGLAAGDLVEFHDIVWSVGNEIYESPPQPSGGSITLPEEPGLGITPDWDVLDEYEDGSGRS